VSYLSIHDADRVFQFLLSTGRLDLPRESWLDASGYLEHRADMAIRNLVRRTDPDARIAIADKVWLQTWIHGHADLVNREGTFPFLNAAKRQAARTGRVDLNEIDPARRFLVVRAKPEHPDAWLTNMLIADFVPDDFISRYVFNKQAFYKDYGTYEPNWRRHVVDTLKTAYLSDKAGLRRKLYGLVD
jgi:hypothetical protein